MDVLALLSHAIVKDDNGVELGTVKGIHFVEGKMLLSIDMTLFDEEDDDDPDDGEKEDIPEEDASNVVQDIRAIAGGRNG